MARKLGFSGTAIPVVLAAGAVLSGLIGFYFGTEEALVAKPVADRKGPDAASVWFTPSNQLGAWWRDGSVIRVELSDPAGKKVQRFESAAPSEPISVSGDGRWLVWKRGAQLVWRDLTQKTAKDLMASIDASSTGTAVIDDGSVAILLPNGDIEVRKPGAASGDRFASQVASPSFLDARGKYIAVASASEWAVHRNSNNAWTLAERNRSTAPLTGLWVSPEGRVAAETDQGIVGTASSSSVPGKVRSRAAGASGDLFVAGDFDGILRLRPGFPPQEMVVPKPPATSIAASGDYLAFANPGGIRVRRFELEQVLTPIGVRSAWIAGLMGVGFAAYFAFGFVSHLMNWKFKTRAISGQTGLEPFPPDLATAILDGQCVLYGGDQLSSLAGFPTWVGFAPNLIDWAEKEGLLGGLDAATLRDQVARGDAHGAIDALVAANQSTRIKLGERYLQIFGGESRMSAVHAALLDLPFTGLIVSTLDRALDLLALNRSSVPFTLGHTGFDQVAKSGDFFALRLRGDLERIERAALSRSELATKLKTQSEHRDLMTFLLTKRTVLFIGVEPEDIVAELGQVHLHESPGRHFAYIPVDEESEHARKASARLESYGIEVFPYPRARAEAALAPVFKALGDHVIAAMEHSNKKPKA